jgi:hypothetical protein
MFHYRVFGCLGADLVGGRYHNLLHFVHKLLHTVAPDENVCRLFTNCLQTVTPRKKCKFMSRHGCAIPFLYEGAIRQHQTWAAIQKENGESTNSEFGAKLATADNAPKG